MRLYRVQSAADVISHAGAGWPASLPLELGSQLTIGSVSVAASGCGPVMPPFNSVWPKSSAIQLSGQNVGKREWRSIWFGSLELESMLATWRSRFGLSIRAKLTPHNPKANKLVYKNYTLLRLARWSVATLLQPPPRPAAGAAASSPMLEKQIN